VSIRFLADADLKHAIIEGCLRQEPALDFALADEAGLRGRRDPEVLAIAARLGRVLVSHDRRTMPIHCARFLQAGNRSPGVLLISQAVPVREAIDSLVLVWAASWPSELENRIHYLPSFEVHVFRW
jgi:predicted nuclease of predicted toxin-antitoxin system